MEYTSTNGLNTKQLIMQCNDREAVRIAEEIGRCKMNGLSSFALENDLNREITRIGLATRKLLKIYN